MSHRVFVFGTLKRGFPNHDVLGSEPCFVSEASTVASYPLYVTGRWYSPVVVDEPGSGYPISGELYDVDDETLARLDRLESVGEPGGYRRLTISVKRGAQREHASIYVKDRADIEVIHSEERGTYLDGRYLHRRDRMLNGTEVVKDIAYHAHEPMSYEDVTARIDSTRPTDHVRGYVPAYTMGIYDLDCGVRYGQISLRVGETNNIVQYAGHIGYGIDEPHRGNRRAAKACEAIRPLVRRHYLKLIITTDPDNHASQRTLDRIGAQHIDTVDVDENSPTFMIEGSRQKMRYVWEP
jgi:gamma-glutamylcyclotransferase (GGCT)/AIG2-like uncharacterized protein YtfP/predicted acetyltransferase